MESKKQTFVEKIASKLLPISEKLNNNKYLGSMRDGFYYAMPLIIVGSLFLIFPNFPIPAVVKWVNKTFGTTWIDYCNRAYNFSVGIMTIFVIIGIAKSLANRYKKDEVQFIINSILAFMLVTPETLIKDNSFIPMANFQAQGLFVGMIIAFCACDLTNWVLNKHWTIKMPDSVPANVANSFEGLVPTAFVMIVFTLIFFLFKITPFKDAQTCISKLIQIPLEGLGASLPATLFLEFLMTLLFSLGLHGPNIVGAVTTPIWTALTIQNANAYAKGQPVPNIINAQFDGNFVRLGGTGATFGLIILLLFFAKSKQYKSLGKLAAAPSIFNINEPLIFGLPIVMNPIMMIPFIFSPIVFGGLTYLVVRLGLVPPANGINLPWTMLPVISGLFLSGWRGAVWQLVEIIISVGWYYPFFKVADKEAWLKEQGKD